MIFYIFHCSFFKDFQGTPSNSLNCFQIIYHRSNNLIQFFLVCIGRQIDSVFLSKSGLPSPFPEEITLCTVFCMHKFITHTVGIQNFYETLGQCSLSIAHQTSVNPLILWWFQETWFSDDFKGYLKLSLIKNWLITLYCSR